MHDHLNQLARARKLNYFLHQSVEQVKHSGNGTHGNGTPQPVLGIINVILARPRGDAKASSRVMSVVGGSNLEARDQIPKKARVMVPPSLSFSEEDKQGTLQPHDDALVVTVRIGGYDVRRILVYQGSIAEIMYPDLY